MENVYMIGFRLSNMQSQQGKALYAVCKANPSSIH